MLQYVNNICFLYATILKQHVYKNVYVYICFCNNFKMCLLLSGFRMDVHVHGMSKNVLHICKHIFVFYVSI